MSDEADSGLRSMSLPRAEPLSTTMPVLVHLLYISNSHPPRFASDIQDKFMPQNPIDIASRVSPRLSALLSSRANNPECEQPVTLMAVRRFLADLLPDDFKEAERLHHFDVDISILDELDALVEEFGGSALAIDFVQVNASEQLSLAIESVVNDENRENPPTLETVRDALLAGLGARLVGDGVLEDDEDDTLLAEIEALIEHFGADTLAEELLSSE